MLSILKRLELGLVGLTTAGLVASLVTQNVNYVVVPSAINVPVFFWTRKKQEDLVTELKTLNDDNSKKIKSLTSAPSLFNADLQEYRDRSIVLANGLKKVNALLVEKDHIISELESKLGYSEAQAQERLSSMIQEIQSYQVLNNQLDTDLNYYAELNRSLTLQLDDSRSEYQSLPVRGRTESRQRFLNAINSAEWELIITCPWIRSQAITGDIYNALVRALDRGVTISIGWGHLSDLYNNGPLTRDNLLRVRPEFYSGIPILEDLASRYSSQLTLVVIGTHEKYFIQDQQWAMLGSHNFLSSGSYSSEREIGLLTNDSHIVSSLYAIASEAHS